LARLLLPQVLLVLALMLLRGLLLLLKSSCRQEVWPSHVTPLLHVLPGELRWRQRWQLGGQTLQPGGGPLL
jgi:hypothetical protein